MAKPQENVQAVVDVKKEPDDILVGNNDEKMLDHEVKTVDCSSSHKRRGREKQILSKKRRAGKWL